MMADRHSDKKYKQKSEPLTKVGQTQTETDRDRAQERENFSSHQQQKEEQENRKQKRGDMEQGNIETELMKRHRNRTEQRRDEQR